jgi:hypothetical protein
MTYFPDCISISISENSKGVDSILFHIIVLSKGKNNFTLGPFITNKEGFILLDSNEITSEIETLCNDFPMDYIAGEDNISEDILIEIEGKSSTERRIQNLEKYYPESAMKLVICYENSINSTFDNDYQFKTKISKLIDVSLS